MEFWTVTGIPALLWSVCLAAGCLLASRQLIHWFQLESYQFPGYFRTLKRQGIRACIPGALMCAGLLSGFIAASWFAHFLPFWLNLLFLCLWPVLLGAGIHRWASLQKAKKKLVFTPRVKRLYAVCLILWTILYYLLIGLILPGVHAPAAQALALAGFALLLPLWIALGGLLAWPIEKGISELYFRDAQRILRERNDLIRIGITGSWGKTSVKFILGTMLNEKYPTLVTPASFNTPMGVTRVIRTQLEPGHRIFVAEMGARHVGDIREMCRLVHPQMGILTSVGPQHLDTFHTQERITRTKYELIDAIPDEGSCFFADDGAIVKGLWEKTAKEKYLAGLDPDADSVWAEDIRVTPEGSRFTIRTGEVRIPCETVLLGELNIRNIVLCASVCLKLGLNGKEIARGIRKLRPVEHRLELKQRPGGLRILDDAFNSNIRGAEQAFHVLREFPGKRIVVTPGMVELGREEAQMNRRFGREMAACCDEAVLVGRRRSEAIAEGLREAGFKSGGIHVVSSLQEAAELLESIAAAGDTVLFENDLPDNYSEE